MMYPDDLPCVSRVEGHSAAMSAGLIRTRMTGGNARQRRGNRALEHVLDLVFVIPQATLRAWLEWVNANAWRGWFDIRLPGLKAGGLGLDTAPTSVRFGTGLTVDLLQIHRLWYWRIRVAAEYVPAAGDFIVATGDWIIGGTPDAPALEWVIGGTPDAPAPDMTNPGTVQAPTVYV